MRALQGDTIVAISTAVGPAGIGIVRLSGERAIDIAGHLFRPAGGGPTDGQAARSVRVGRLVDPRTGEFIDEAVLLVMKAPRSYTREDVAEIQCHGGPVPLRRVLEAAVWCGARLASPGEFTKRAFLHGRLDLAQAEAVADIVGALTERGLAVAMGNLRGALSREVRQLREELLDLTAAVEASIDFPEYDEAEMGRRRITDSLTAVGEALGRLLEGAATGRILREGLRTVIAGRPNVGKSSLLNALVGEERAIVTDVPGTTRDAIEECVNLRGIPLVVTDTAGLRRTEDVVERIGVEETRRRLAAADLVLAVVDDAEGLQEGDRELLCAVRGRAGVVVANKADLARAAVEEEEVRKLAGPLPFVRVSALEGRGLTELAESIEALVYRGGIAAREAPLVANVRHRDALARAAESVKEAALALEAGVPVDIAAIDIRAALDSLGEVTGETVDDAIVERIFSRFCIGK